MSRMNLSVVIPVFQNSESLEELVNRIHNVSNKLNVSSEIIAVDDGSTDESRKILSELQKNKEFKIKIISLTKNFGQVPAIFAGLRNSSGSATVVISADLQDPPEIIEELYGFYLSGFEIVIAHRKSREDTLLNRLTSTIAYSLLRRDLELLPKGGFDFFLIGDKARGRICATRGRNLFLQGELLHTGFVPKIVPYNREKRKFGKSTWSFSKRLSYFEDAVVDSARKPFTSMLRIGIFLAAFSFLTGLVSLVSYFVDQTPFPGFTPIFLSILFVGGLQLVLLSIVGQLVVRIYDINRNRIVYEVKEIAN